MYKSATLIAIRPVQLDLNDENSFVCVVHFKCDDCGDEFSVDDEDGGFLALSLICSHLGCSVMFDEVKKQFICPCHSSAFDNLGNVINSPAPRALDYFPVSIEAGKVVVDTGQKKKRKKFESNQVTYAI